MRRSQRKWASTQGVSWTYAAGQYGYDDDRRVTSGTIFDLASLTKVLCTTTLALPLIERGTLRLETLVGAIAAHWTGADRATVTVRDLLEHCSGLPAYRPYYLTFAGRAAYEAAIAAEPLEYPPRTHSIYSDLGFILLGFHPRGRRPVSHSISSSRRGAPARASQRRSSSIRPDQGASTSRLTERDPWRGRVLQGEVHDENAAALGGVAGHAGLFGTGGRSRRSRALVAGTTDWSRRSHDGDLGGDGALCAKRSSVPGSSRGARVGHDAADLVVRHSVVRVRDRSHRVHRHVAVARPATDRYAVLLTNRVHPTRDNDRIQQVRRDFHDAVATDLDADGLR